MAKISLNLSTGIVEKPILSCFKKNDNSYLILDAENVGNMGMPIIYVCKIVGDRVVKINDDAEWQSVKGYLKEIIANQPMEFFMPNLSMPADDVYFTQLTLSNDNLNAIKNSFDGSQNASITADNTVQTDAPVAMENPIDLGVANPNPSNINPIDNNANPMDTVIEQNIVPDIDPSIVNPMVENPVMPGMTPDINPVIPPMESAVETPIAPSIEPVVSNDVVNPMNEVVDAVGMINNGSDISGAKEKFLKGCEMIFEALTEIK